MARNIEIKARIESIEALEPIVASLATQGPALIDQDDTFFRCDTGRLKLRAFSANDGELIYYRRPDDAGPRTSFYLRSPTSAPDALRESLTLAYGQAGRVRKRRTLYLIGRTRVHLDRVERLGAFLELEVVLGDDEGTEQGIAEAHRLMRRFAIAPGRLIGSAYVDLIRDASAADRPPREAADGPPQDETSGRSHDVASSK
jgi:adenylate cyclase class IV